MGFRRATNRSTYAALLGLVACLVGGPHGQAQAPTSQREQELGQVRREISRLQEQIDHLQGEARSRSHELTRTEVELQLQRARLAEARKQRDALERELQALTAAVEELRTELEATEAILVASTQRLQGWSSRSAVRWLLADGDGTDLEQVRWLRYLAGGMSQRRQRFRAQQREFDALRTRLESRRGELADWVALEEQRSQQLIEAHRSQVRELTTVRRKRDQVSTAVASLVDRERRLADFLAVLEGRSFADDTPIQRFRGILDPPVRGTISKGFGPQLDPRYKTRVPHNGLEYRLGTRGQPVRAVYPGEVVYADTFQGFGPTVIIAHPDHVFSLYAGLSSTRVRKGDVVVLQQSIGSANRSLYFEIRLENRPQDPTDWVR